jgi:Flp pilus assembly pilin Flp
MVMGLARRLGRDRRGVTALEFAIVALPFLSLVMLIMEVAWQSAVSAGLDRGAREASRWAATGQAPPAGLTREAYIRRMVSETSGLKLTGPIEVTFRAYANYAAVAAAGTLTRCPPGGGGGLGGSGVVMRYDIRYISAGLTPIGTSLLPAGLKTHCIVVLTTNEPFPQS